MIKELFENGIAEQIAKGNEAEATKVGTLRGGNTGMIDEEGYILGTCAAETYLRFKGIKTKGVDQQKELMFAGGRLNEDHWLDVLKTSYNKPGQRILCESDIPTCWETENGIKVTGRPDIVLCQDSTTEFNHFQPVDGSELIKVPKPVPVCGIELKQCMSINGAYNAFIKKEPNLKHLMQAAHYMWQLDCPFELWYTNRNNLDMPSWMQYREFPKPENEPTKTIGYRYYRWGDINPRTGKPKKHQISETDYLDEKYKKSFAEACKLMPFVQGFKLKLDSDQKLWFKDTSNDSSDWVETIVTIPRIKRFYDYISTIDSTGKVPGEALNVNYSGDLLGWKFKDYSDLKDLHPANYAGKDLGRWLAKIKKQFG